MDDVRTMTEEHRQYQQYSDFFSTERNWSIRRPPSEGIHPGPMAWSRFSGRSSWEQYWQVFEAIVCSNGWDDVTAALQLLSHLDGDALNVALRVLSLSVHYSSPGRLAEYKHQFNRASRRPGDDPSIFAIELETLARRAFVDIDPLIQLQMVRDRFIDGQAECAHRRHLDSLGPILLWQT